MMGLNGLNAIDSGHHFVKSLVGVVLFLVKLTHSTVRLATGLKQSISGVLLYIT